MKILLLVVLCVGLGSMVRAAETVAELEAGKQAIRGGDYAQAIRLLAEAVIRAPRDAELHHWLGNAYAWAAASADLRDKPTLGRKCLAAYRRALEIDADHLSARFGLMNFYRHVPRLLGGGMDRARAEAEEISRRNPVEGTYARALLHAHDKNHDAAFAALEEVRRVRPDHYAALALCGRLALESGRRREKGAAALRRCLELSPADTDEGHEVIGKRLAALSGQNSPADLVARAP